MFGLPSYITKLMDNKEKDKRSIPPHLTKKYQSHIDKMVVFIEQQFPYCPTKRRVAEIAYGGGERTSVGKNSLVDDRASAFLAVSAYARHLYTTYDTITSLKGRDGARKDKKVTNDYNRTLHLWRNGFPFSVIRDDFVMCTMYVTPEHIKFDFRDKEGNYTHKFAYNSQQVREILHPYGQTTTIIKAFAQWNPTYSDSDYKYSVSVYQFLKDMRKWEHKRRRKYSEA